MNDRLTDKLSRLSALRPVGVVRTAGASLPMRRECLEELLEAECRSNCLGSHIVVRRWFAEPQPGPVSPLAVRRILPNAGESILNPGQWLFLDTETTGLAGGTGTYAFMVGIAWWESGGFAVEQYFMRDFNEEPSLLLELSRRLAERRVLVTFNGKSFDWPLLQTRFRITRAADPAEPEAHIDLLHPARRLWRLRLGSVALSELERSILGKERTQDIPSETIPGRYFTYLRGGPAEPVAEIFHHNQMDLCGLASLALHISSLLREPESTVCPAEDLFGLSRLLQQRGEEKLASRTYQRALENGLPRAAEQTAQRELAFLAKRQRDFERSNALWEKLLHEIPDGLKAYEQLAIYYEHHARDWERATALTRDALVRLQQAFQAGQIQAPRYRQWHESLQHRLTRLNKKRRGPDAL